MESFKIIMTIKLTPFTHNSAQWLFATVSATGFQNLSLFTCHIFGGKFRNQWQKQWQIEKTVAKPVAI